MKLRTAAKGMLSMLIAVIMVFSPLLPSSLFTSAAAEEPVDVMKTIFTDMGGENDPDPDAKKEETPYSERTRLLSVSEPMFAGLVTEYTGSGVPRLGNGITTVHGSSYSLELLSVLNSYEGDFDGDGKRDELAYIAGARTKSSAEYGHCDAGYGQRFGCLGLQ